MAVSARDELAHILSTLTDLECEQALSLLAPLTGDGRTLGLLAPLTRDGEPDWSALDAYTLDLLERDGKTKALRQGARSERGRRGKR